MNRNSKTVFTGSLPYGRLPFLLCLWISFSYGIPCFDYDSQPLDAHVKSRPRPPSKSRACYVNGIRACKFTHTVQVSLIYLKHQLSAGCRQTPKPSSKPHALQDCEGYPFPYIIYPLQPNVLIQNSISQKSLYTAGIFFQLS